MPFVCAVSSIFSLCSSQGFSQKLEGQCCFSPFLCAIGISSLSILRGVCVFTKMSMAQRHLVAGNAGTAGWCPRAYSDIPHDELSSNSSVFAHPIRKHYQTFKGTQTHNGHLFWYFELLSNPSSLGIFLKVPVLHTGCPHKLLHLHIPVSLCSWLFDHIDLYYLICLPLIFHLAENMKTLRQCRLFSFCLLRQQNNFCLCRDKYFLMFWLHSLLSNSRILELVSLTKGNCSALPFRN